MKNNKKVIFEFCTAYHDRSCEEIGRHVAYHGDGLKDLSFKVDDCHAVYNRSIKNGAISVRAPTKLED